MIILTHKKIFEGSLIKSKTSLDGKVYINGGFAKNVIDKNRRFEDCEGLVLTSYGPVYAQDVIDVVNESIQNIIAMDGTCIGKRLSDCDIVYTGYIPTMQTDGKSIFINPGFVAKLYDICDSTKGVEYVIIHETLHVLFDHCKQFSRMKGEYSNHSQANVAMDCLINWFIENYIRVGLNYPYRGLHTLLKGQWNEKHGRMGSDWVDIYPDVEPFTSTKRSDVSIDFARGFIDGYLAQCSNMKDQGLIELL